MDFLKLGIAQYVGKTGAPGRSRTCDPQYRKLMLYPAELRVHLVMDVCTEGNETNVPYKAVSKRGISQL